MNIFLLGPEQKLANYYAAADYNTRSWTEHNMALAAIGIGLQPSTAPLTLVSSIECYGAIRKSGYERLPLKYLDWAIFESDKPILEEDFSQISRTLRSIGDIGIHDFISRPPTVHFLGSIEDRRLSQYK